MRYKKKYNKLLIEFERSKEMEEHYSRAYCDKIVENFKLRKKLEKYGKIQLKRENELSKNYQLCLFNDNFNEIRLYINGKLEDKIECFKIEKDENDKIKINIEK